jgi:ribosomal protein S18 acetylase RimI-like enzyme
VTCRIATNADCTLLGELNHQLIRDEGHRNPMNAEELSERMREWIEREYKAVIFEQGGTMVGYALFREEEKEIYLRQLFICREDRRRGFGRKAMSILKDEIWPTGKRLTVEVLVANDAAVRFWRAMGYRDYALTLEIMPPEP